MNITRRTIQALSFLLAALSRLALIGWRRRRQRRGEEKSELIEKLRSDAPGGRESDRLQAAGDLRQPEAVPELAKLLTDEQLASWSRIALEAIPGPAATKRCARRSTRSKADCWSARSTRSAFAAMTAPSSPLTARLTGSGCRRRLGRAVALGHIGNAAATKSAARLAGRRSGQSPARRSPKAASCAPSDLLAEGKTDEAVEIYDEVRKADVPKQKVSKRRAARFWPARPTEFRCLVEQLRSTDSDMFHLGLSTARELAGREVADALAAEVGRARRPIERLCCSLAFADRRDSIAAGGARGRQERPQAGANCGHRRRRSLGRCLEPVDAARRSPARAMPSRASGQDGAGRPAGRERSTPRSSRVSPRPKAKRCRL